MNINDPSQVRDCTSCQVCGAVCPTDAISIELNKDGFYRPNIELNKCIDCGKCVQICYKFDYSIRVTSDLSTKKLFAAWVKDSDILKETTSGGVADIIAKKLQDEGYKCVGVTYDPEDNIAKGKIANDRSDLSLFRGSKYIQSLSVESFKSVVRKCKKEKFAIFGLPCQIYALSRFLENMGIRNKHVLIDLYCHGCPSIFSWKKYLSELLIKYDRPNVLSVNFRSKTRGWGNYSLVVNMKKNDKVITYISPKINDKFYDLFFSDTILNDSCHNCITRSTFEYTDVRLGDYWGPEYLNNYKGVSGVTICTENGSNIWDKIKGEFVQNEKILIEFVANQSYGKTYSVDTHLRSMMLNTLANESLPLEDTVKLLKERWTYSHRIKNTAKNLIKLMPRSIIAFAKQIIYKL